MKFRRLKARFTFMLNKLFLCYIYIFMILTPTIYVLHTREYQGFLPLSSIK